MNWTRQWWNELAETFDLYTSPAVILELERGSTERTADRIALLADVELLEINDEIETIASAYIERLVMPNDPGGDALHLAIASFHGMDVLLTWNCRHLANPNKIAHIQAVNAEMNLSTPFLTTPYNYIGGGEADV